MDISIDDHLAPFPTLRGFAVAALADPSGASARLHAVLRVLAQAARATSDGTRSDTWESAEPGGNDGPAR